MAGGVKVLNEMVNLGFPPQQAKYLDDNIPNKTGDTALTFSRSVTLWVPAGLANIGGKTGGAVDWVITSAATDAPAFGGHATLAASATGASCTLPVTGLQLGDVITAFKVIAQIESAGNTATLDADLRELRNVAAEPTSHSIGAITQVSVTADTAAAAAKTGLSFTVVTGKNVFALITGTTAANTDVQLLGVEVVVTRTY